MESKQPDINGIIAHRSLIENVSKTYLFFKRCFDLAISLPTVILLLPVILTIALWIKVRYKGIVLRIEEKFGLKGKRFVTYEFEAVISNPYFRKLPLFFNVLKGNMSLVGPLPVPIEEIKLDPWYHLRMSAKPGIAGMWQASGKTGGVNEMARVDLKYIRERSLRTDMKIILKSILLMLGKKKPQRIKKD